MEFDLSDEQRALQQEARRFLEREAPISYARAMMDDARGYTDEVWRKMAGLGWMGLPFGEEHGGVGMGFIALSILLSEMGRVVLPGPYFASVALAGGAIESAGTDAQRKDLLPGIAAGETVASVALDEPAGRRGPDAIACEARPDGAGYRLHGEKRFVLDGQNAARLVVVARAPDGVGLFSAEAAEAAAVGWMDLTRKAADVRFDGTPAERLGDAGWPAVQRVLDRAAVALAAEMLGGAERVLELAVDYAKERVQFDRPIGSFQAIKHKAADMLLEVESLRSAVYYAAWAIERDHPDASLAASMAKAYASDAFRHVASQGIQIHGGIGFTWEHDMHLYFKRAKSSEALLGDAVWHRERMAQILRERYAPAR